MNFDLSKLEELVAAVDLTIRGLPDSPIEVLEELERLAVAVRTEIDARECHRPQSHQHVRGIGLETLYSDAELDALINEFTTERARRR